MKTRRLFSLASLAFALCGTMVSAADVAADEKAPAPAITLPKPESLSPAAPPPRIGNAEIARAFSRPITNKIWQDEDIRVVLQAMGTAADVTIIPDPDVTGKVSVALNNATLHGALRAVCAPLGYYFTEDAGGWISVRKKRMVIFSVNYPQMTRGSTASAAVTINSGNSRNSSSGGYGSSGSTISNSSNRMGSTGGTGGSGAGGSDSTQFSITQQNQADFWKTLETRVKAIIESGETVMVDPFSGLITVEAGQRSISKVHELILAINKRIGTRIDIMCRIVEVTTSNQDKLGVDWGVVGEHVISGGVSLGQRVIQASTGATIAGVTMPTNITTTGQFSFNPDTLVGSVSFGKVDAVLSALKEQGDVKQISSPRLSTLNNQTAYIKDGIDRPFFSLSSEVTINAGGTTTAGTQPITSNTYSKETYAIGTALQVTPQAEADLVTLDVSPAISRLQEIVTSPDGTQNAPVLQNKQTGVIVRVKSGETAVVGGLITQADSQTIRGIPVLGDIPYLGRLFSTKGNVKQTSELVIFITPTIIRYDNPSCIVSDAISNIEAPLLPADRKVEGISF